MGEFKRINESADEMVLAVGDSGHFELTPRNETVAIPVYPVGPGGKVTPATIRWQINYFSDERRPGLPVRVLGIQTEGKPFPVVTWEDTKGRQRVCCMICAEDANDPLFTVLPKKDRARLAAVWAD